MLLASKPLFGSILEILLLCNSGCSGSHHTDQADLKLEFNPPAQSPKCFDCNCFWISNQLKVDACAAISRDDLFWDGEKIEEELYIF